MEFLPAGWQYTREQLERHYRLSSCYDDADFISNVYAQINLLQFLGKSYAKWEFEDEVKSAYCQNYLVILASVIEAVLRKTYEKKTLWCKGHCKKGAFKICPVVNFPIGKNGNKSIPTAKATFFELLIAASHDGLLEGMSEDELHQIRFARNMVHMNAIEGDYKSEERFSSNFINKSIGILNKVLVGCVKWLDQCEKKCLMK